MQSRSNPPVSLMLTLPVLSSKLAEEPPLFWMAHRHQRSLEWPCPCSGAGLAQVPLESFQSNEKSPRFPLQQDRIPPGQRVLATGDSPVLWMPGRTTLANCFLPRVFLVCCGRSLGHLKEQSHREVDMLTLLSHCFAQAQRVALPLWWA